MGIRGELLVGVDESTAKDFPVGIGEMLTKELKKYPRGSLLFMKAVNAGLNQFNRRELQEELKPLRTKMCPFANVPEKKRHKHALTVEKMTLCAWLKPERRCELAYYEWTPSAHLRHPEPGPGGLRSGAFDEPEREQRRTQHNHTEVRISSLEIESTDVKTMDNSSLNLFLFTDQNSKLIEN